MVSKILIFLPAPKVGGPGPPTFRGGGASVPPAPPGATPMSQVAEAAEAQGEYINFAFIFLNRH